MIKQRQQLGIALSFFFPDRKSFSLTWHRLIVGRPPHHGNMNVCIQEKDFFFFPSGDVEEKRAKNTKSLVVRDYKDTLNLRG